MTKHINILNKLEKKLIFFLEYLKIFKNLYDNLYYIKLNSTKFTYYVDVMINTRENTRLNFFDKDDWILICKLSLSSEEFAEYINNKDFFNVELLKIVIDGNKFHIPETYVNFKIIEFKNGIYNLINNVFIDFSKIYYIYDDFIKLDIKSLIYCDKNYNGVSEFPIYFIDELKISDLPDDKKINGLHFFSALCIYMGYLIKQHGIIQSTKFLEDDNFLKIIEAYIKDTNIKTNIAEIYNNVLIIFYLLENLISINTTDRNDIMKNMISTDIISNIDEKEFKQFLQMIYLSCLAQIKKLDSKNYFEENPFFNYIAEVKNSLDKKNFLYYWYTYYYIDNLIILLLHSYKALNNYIFLENRITNNIYLTLLEEKIYDSILLCYSDDEITSLNNLEKNYNDLNILIEEKKSIDFYYNILNKLLFL